jgi:hypothetical protein
MRRWRYAPAPVPSRRSRGAVRPAQEQDAIIESKNEAPRWTPLPKRRARKTMETFKTAAVFVAICGVFAFNLRLYSDKQGVLLSTEKDPGRWYFKCRYYTPFRLFHIRQPIQNGCSDYAPIDR